MAVPTTEEIRTVAQSLIDDGNSHEYVEGCSTCKAQMFKFRKVVTPQSVLTLITEADRLKAENETAIERGLQIHHCSKCDLCKDHHD